MNERLCKDLKIGSSYTIRKRTDITKRFAGKEEVVIDRFELWDNGPPPQCGHKDAQLIIFKGHKNRYHPFWILNCHECPYYIPHNPHEPQIDRMAREALTDELKRLREENVTWPQLSLHEE